MSDTASLITLRSILDLEIARSYQWDAATIIAISGVDRAGDLTTRIVEVPGSLSDIAAEGFSPHSAASRHERSATIPSPGSIRRFAIPRFYAARPPPPRACSPTTLSGTMVVSNFQREAPRE